MRVIKGVNVQCAGKMTKVTTVMARNYKSAAIQ